MVTEALSRKKQATFKNPIKPLARPQREAGRACASGARLGDSASGSNSATALLAILQNKQLVLHAGVF
jgi:hypothetical protein